MIKRNNDVASGPSKHNLRHIDDLKVSKIGELNLDYETKGLDVEIPSSIRTLKRTCRNRKFDMELADNHMRVSDDDDVDIMCKNMESEYEDLLLQKKEMKTVSSKKKKSIRKFVSEWSPVSPPPKRKKNAKKQNAYGEEQDNEDPLCDPSLVMKAEKKLVSPKKEKEINNSAVAREVPNIKLPSAKKDYLLLPVSSNKNSGVAEVQKYDNESMKNDKKEYFVLHNVNSGTTLPLTGKSNTAPEVKDTNEYCLVTKDRNEVVPMKKDERINRNEKEKASVKLDGNPLIMMKCIGNNYVLARKLITYTGKPVFANSVPDEAPFSIRNMKDEFLEEKEVKSDLLVKKGYSDSFFVRKGRHDLLLVREENAKPVPSDVDNKVKGSSELKGIDLKDKFTSLPNDFVRIDFASPKKQVKLKLIQESETSTLRCSTLQGLLCSLKEKNLLQSEIEDLLNTFGVLPKGLRIKHSENTVKYELFRDDDNTLKEFASLLFINSLRTYDMVNKYFLLPDKTVIRNRLQVEGYWPGFTKEALLILKKLALKDTHGIDKMCSIMCESITVKKMYELEKSSKKWIGNVDLIGGLDLNDADEIPLATEILIFTAVGLGTNWKLPFGYFLHKGVPAELLKNLLHEAIFVLEEHGLYVKALVCSGSGVTQRLGMLLGCNIHARKWIDIMPSFPHPLRENIKIYLLFSTRNSIFLLENLLKSIGSIQNGVYGKVDWKFLRLLIGDRKQTRGPECVLLANLKQLPFYYLQRISRHCSSVFNRVVSKALNTAKELDIDGYATCKDTANFVADIYRALCVLNSRNRISSEERLPIYQITLQEQLESMNTVAERLIGMETLFGHLISQERQWMSVILLAFTLKSVSHLAADLVAVVKVPYFCTYRVNMDHFDIVLNVLQRIGGWKEPPTPLEFKNAYRNLFKRLSNKYFVNFDFEGEDVTLDQGEIFTYSSNENYVKYPVFTDLETDLAHLATSLIQDILQRLSCPGCVSVLIDDLQEYHLKYKKIFVNYIRPSRFVLQLLKVSGRLVNMKMSESCTITSEHLVLYVNYKYLSLFEKLNLPESALEHFIEEPYHVICLIKVMIRRFIQGRFCKRKQRRS